MSEKEIKNTKMSATDLFMIACKQIQKQPEITEKDMDMIRDAIIDLNKFLKELMNGIDVLFPIPKTPIKDRMKDIKDTIIEKCGDIKETVKEKQKEFKGRKLEKLKERVKELEERLKE